MCKIFTLVTHQGAEILFYMQIDLKKIDIHHEIVSRCCRYFCLFSSKAWWILAWVLVENFKHCALLLLLFEWIFYKYSWYNKQCSSKTIVLCVILLKLVKLSIKHFQNINTIATGINYVRLIDLTYIKTCNTHTHNNIYLNLLSIQCFYSYTYYIPNYTFNYLILLLGWVI